MAEADYSADLPTPQLIEQGRTNDLRIVVRRSGAVVIPTLATITITDGSGTVLVDAANVTIVDGIPSYPTATFASSQRGAGWLVSWALTLGGKVRHYRAPAILVACLPYPTVSDQTIYDRLPMLQASLPGSVTKATTHQAVIDRTWREMLRWLERQGPRPHLVVNQDALEEPHLLLAISRIFEDLSVNQPKYAEYAKLYLEKHRLALADVQVSEAVDSSATGAVGRKKSARGSTWACGR